MARVERKDSTEQIPVEQAQLMPDFQLDTFSAQTLKQIGGVITELAVRKRDADDSLAVNAAGESRDLAKLQMRQFMLDNPDPDTWPEGLTKILDDQTKTYSQQKLSAQAKADEDIEQQAFIDELRAGTQIAITSQTIENDITVSGKNLINSMTNDDGSVSDAAEIDKRLELYKEALARKLSPELAAIQMEETLREGKKGFYVNQSKLFPDEVISQMEKKKKALGKGGRDKEGLTAKDFDDIIASAYNSKALDKKSLDVRAQEQLDILGQGLQDGTINYTLINSMDALTEEQQESYRIKMNAEAKRKADGLEPVTDQARKHELLDMAAAIKWPERQVKSQEVKRLANESRFGINANLDNAAYDEIRDAIRRSEEDKIPFTQKYIETTIGELITGAPSSVLGLPLPTLRTREDAIKHATNAFGRFINRVPGVMETIDAKFPPEKPKSTPEEPKDTPAYDFDGELIGSYNIDGSITLNQEGARRLWELAGRDMEKARQMAEQHRYIIPTLKE